MKITRIRKAVSITEYPAIGKISIKASTLLVVVLFIYWVGQDIDEMDSKWVLKQNSPLFVN